MRNSNGHLVHRFTDLDADRREQRRKDRAAQVEMDAQAWADAATPEELREILEDGDYNPNAQKVARRRAALRIGKEN